MIWIIILLAIGILLFFAEIFFVPGTTIVGIVGIICTGIGIYLAYTQHSSVTGHITLAVTLIAITATVIIGAKSKVWEKLSNKDAIKSKVNVIEESEIKVGDKGTAISAIRPIGKARINDKSFEVKSLGEYVDSGTSVEVIKIKGNNITIKSLMNSNSPKA